MNEETALFVQRIERLEDLEQIRQLFVDYGRYLDDRNWAELAALFHDQGELILDPLGRATGPRAIEKLMSEGLSNVRGATFHLIANPVIIFEGTRATSDVTWALITRTNQDTPALTVLGRHRDVLAKEGGRWRLFRRQGVLEIPSVFPGSPTLRTPNQTRE